jgi:hypothetical protein
MNQVCCATTGKQGNKTLKIIEDHGSSSLKFLSAQTAQPFFLPKAWHQKPPNGPLQLICRTNSEPRGGQKAPYCELLHIIAMISKFHSTK